jgi:flap endonuclease-1
MGIPKLNKLLLERCPNAIEKIHLETLLNKKIAVDISIYLYKFIVDGDYMEHLYLFLSVFKYYCIVPIFVFDGKPPPEKSALLKRRHCEKQEAYREYKSLEQQLSEISDPKKLDELEKTMNSLKKKMVRITSDHINKAVELIKAFGFEHHFAPNEADQLCVYLTTIGITYATLSDDMDMIVSGCSIVLRNLSLMNHEVSLYNTQQIVDDLGLSLDEFRDIVVLSGTDYEISSNATNNTTNTNISVRKAFEYFRKYKDSQSQNDFYTWLSETGIIDNVDLYKISELMNINTYVNILEEFIQNNMSEKPKFSVSMIKTIMKQYKFIFV